MEGGEDVGAGDVVAYFFDFIEILCERRLGCGDDGLGRWPREKIEACFDIKRDCFDRDDADRVG